jgi:hypothetical protein
VELEGFLDLPEVPCKSTKHRWKRGRQFSSSLQLRGPYITIAASSPTGDLLTTARVTAASSPYLLIGFGGESAKA